MSIKDANDLLQAWQGNQMPAQRQQETVARLLGGTRTLVEAVCWDAGAVEGAEGDTAKQEAMKLVADLSEEQVEQYGGRLAKALGLTEQKVKSWAKSIRAERAKAGKRDAAAGGEPVDYIGGWMKDHLVELIYDPETVRTSFAVRYPDGRIERADHLELDGTRYVPMYPNNMVVKNVVLLPSELAPLRPTAELVRDIRAFIHKYLDVDDFYESLASYYVLFSWVYDAFPQLPYLRALGDYGTGKSRLLFVVGAPCYRPIFTGGATTTSPIFRMLDMWHGTLILDEADFGQSDEKAEIIKILNTGYQKGVPVLRTSGDGRSGFNIDAFDVYGPKILGSRKRFFDQATESRCLTAEMGSGMPRADIPIVLPKAFWVEARELRNQLLAYRMQNWAPEIDVDFNATNRVLEPRLNQITLALKKVVENDARMISEIDRFVLDYSRQSTTERSMTMPAKILEALVAVRPSLLRSSAGDVQGVYLKDLGIKVNELIDEQNREMGDDLGDEQNREMGDDLGDDDQGQPQAAQGQGQEQKGEEKKKKARISSRKVGDMARKYLQLRTDRTTAGEAARKGTYFVVWDTERIRGLCNRWGVTYGPNGHSDHAEADGKADVVDILHPSKELLDSFDKSRDAWKNAGQADAGRAERAMMPEPPPEFVDEWDEGSYV